MTRHALLFVLCIAGIVASFIGSALCVPDHVWWAVALLVVVVTFFCFAVGQLRAAIDAGKWGRS